ncbi:uncharacterized protein PAC_03400 [Phialocephala subalpina]|uniref:Uncharacterized protein n=1 Tax=Phialocephala subalpina TaxID=576137 RepID=A0A1L7WL60_9HELO|nr:uncharacterized protein PAC_03400 [Phialocephala subalpina]
MSFGWSAGDIVAAINLVNRVFRSISNVSGAREHFQELRAELQTLLRALHEISDLARLPGQHPDVTALKFAACLCQETLARFLEKIKPFDESLALGSRSSRLKAVPRMVRWELLVKKDIPEFRSYLVAHVGALNLRISTVSLKVTSTSSARSDEHHAQHRLSIQRLERELQRQTESICARITSIPQKDTIPQLKSLLEIAMDVWKAQKDLTNLCSKALDTVPPPESQYTWAQSPVKFEDALGRVIPVPSEYGWETLEAVIQAQFKTGPGQEKVLSGEYELWSSGQSIVELRQSTPSLIPGMIITMTFIIGQYAGSERCPQLGCQSRLFAKDAKGNKTQECTSCGTTFRETKSPLPMPMKPTATSCRESAPKYRTDDSRRCFRNISLFITELPKTPTTFRGSYYRSKERKNNVNINAVRYDPAAVAKIEQDISCQLQLPETETKTVSYRPYTEMFRCIETVSLSYRPQTLIGTTTVTSTPSTRNKGRTKTRLPAHHPSLGTDCLKNHEEEIQATLEMLGQTFHDQDSAQRPSLALDQDFQEESGAIEPGAIEHWFMVLSESERTATLYALIQQTTEFQQYFFLALLKCFVVRDVEL